MIEHTTNSEHYFYKKLVNYLEPLYKKIPKEKMEQLSNCSYEYFLFVLEIDKLLDEKSQKDNEQYVGNIFIKIAQFEETIKKLVTLFPITNPFWRDFNKCKHLYIETNLLEKRISELDENISIEIFEKLATGKSALCIALVDALVCLSGDITYANELKIFLEHFHIAFQYRDDIDDFKRDIECRQKTFIYEELQQKFKISEIPFSELNSQEKYKYIFLTGLATKHFEKAIDHYKISLDAINGLGLDELAEYIDKQVKECNVRIFEIDNLIEKAKNKSTKSLKIRSKNDSYKTDIIKDALNYLSNNIDKYGFWSDFLTSKGTGKYWVTSYVGFNIMEPNWSNTDIGNTVMDVVNKINILDLQGSYNENMIPDGDSMNFYIGFLNKLNMDILPDQLNKWLSYVTQTGGWMTYNNVKDLQEALHESEIDVSGWISPKDCVSAASCYILSEFPSLKKVFESTVEYLLKRFNENGQWQSYWWSDDMYATSFALCALKQHEKYSALISNVAEWIIKRQTDNGCWQNDFTKENSAFYTSMAIKALLVVDKNKYRDHIEKGIDFLALNQLEDGGWFGSYSLRIPATNIEDITRVNTWRKGSFGSNILAEDYNRIMTTSTVINAIGNYLTAY